MAFILSISVMEWMRTVDSTPHAILTLTANMHRSRGPAHQHVFCIYRTRAYAPLLIALYTANLTSAVLQEKALIGNNEKKTSSSQFSVVAEGPSYRWGTSSQGHSRRFQPKPQRRLYHHVGTGREAGGRQCDPLVSVSGAINRIPYSMAIRAGTVDEKLINDNLQVALADTRKLPWCHGSNSVTRVWRRRCQIDVATMLPLLWVSIAVYALAGRQDHDSCVREATSTHEQFAYVYDAHRQTGFLRPPSLCGL
jgi:hypothetical protein